MIRVENATKTYQIDSTKVHALDGVSIEVNHNDFVFIVGPSGSGKTTLLDIMGGLLKPTSGKVIIDNRNIEEFNDWQLSLFRRDRIGFIFQTFNLVPTLTALENVLVPMIPAGITPKLEKKARELLTELGLGKRMYHKPGQLSGGERQRVAIARALVNDPVIVLADEPTGELDSKIGQEIFTYMRKLNKEKDISFVIVTHDVEYIKKDDLVYTIKDGKIHEGNNMHFKPKK